MSREIKFRAWDKDLAKYLGGCEIDSPMAELSADDDGKGVIIKQICPARYIFEQYTGLKDQNGKEIYEGDIVKMPDWQVKPKYEKVRFAKLSCGFEPFVCGCFECIAPDGEEVEVIGNIHENGELLGGEE